MTKKGILMTILVAMLIFLSANISAPSTEMKVKNFSNDQLMVNRNNAKIFIKNNETDYWAVIVGIGDYKGKHDLPLNETCIYNALLTTKNWKDSHIKLLVNENATRDAILDALEWLKENADDSDIILFSYQGHGSEDSGKVGIVPWEGMDGFITVDELDEKFDEINAKGMCLIFDCCLSGSFVDEGKKENIVEINKAGKFWREFTTGIEGNNRVILMSTMRGGLGASIKIHNSVTNTTKVITFSNWIAEGIRKNIDYNRDGICSAEEVFYYTKIRFFPIAIFLLNPIWQLKTIIATGHPILAFPQIYDGYKGPLPIVIK